MSRYEWRELTGDERSNFLKLYQESENKYKLFQWIKSSPLTMYLWVLFVMMLGLFGIFSSSCSDEGSLLSNFFLKIVFFCCGVIGLQIVFVAAHVKAHALFLEYDEHVPGSQRIQERPIYFYAFYHHHHTQSDNWAPSLGYHDKKNSFIMEHEGARNVIASHWHGFSMLTSKTILMVLLFVMLYPPLACYFFGYEVGVLLLPLAHGWQHVKKERYGFLLSRLFMILESMGLVANGHDHGRHHVHSSPTVYQDFSSSGLYMKKIDKHINKWWDQAFYAPDTTPYDYLKPFVSLVYMSIGVYVPLLFCFI